MAHFGELGVEAGGFADGAFDGADVGHLGADMEMHELEAVGESGGMEHVAGLDEVGGGKAELGILAAAGGPLAGALGEQSDAEADEGLDFHRLRNTEDVCQLFELFHDEDDCFAELAAEEGVLNEARVLVAVADHEALGVRVHGERGEELGLAPGLDAEVPGLAGVDDLLHDFAELVHLDRKNPTVGRGVAGLGDRRGEGCVDRLHAVAQEVVEAHDERKCQLAAPRLGDDIHEIDRLAVALGINADMAAFVDAEVAAAPAVDVVEFAGLGDVEGCGVFHGFRN